jgi:hypothetical protein
MSKLLTPDRLLELLFEDIDEKSPCVVYMGIGTNYEDYGTSRWNRELNQQMPIFLHDWKINNYGVPVKIILFDGIAKNSPYIVKDEESYYAESFMRDSKYVNVYKSYFGIQVYDFHLNVKWTNDEYNMPGDYDITNLVAKIVKRVSESNHVFFFHEFTGRNPEQLEYQIKKMTKYDDSKVCIDISRGRDLSCCVNFSEPENYPLINMTGRSITWVNPKLFSFEKKRELNKKFNKANIESNSTPYENCEIYDFYLYRQMMNINQYIYNCCTKIIYFMRLLYDKETKLTKIDKKYILNVDTLTMKINGIQKICNSIIAHTLQVDQIITTLHDEDTAYAHKLSLLEKLNTLLEICVGEIKEISKEDFDELLSEFETLENKNRLITVFRNFCIRHEIIF